jgi:hypothetical protein
MNKNGCLRIIATITVLVTPSLPAKGNLLSSNFVIVPNATPIVDSSTSPLRLSAAVNKPSRLRAATSPFKQLIDFNGDGKTDLSWYNYNNGNTSAWLIKGSSATYPPIYNTVPPSTGWSIKGFGDFDGDGKTDIFWYNYKTGDTAVWLIDGGSVRTYTGYANVPPSSGWSIKGFGDFDGDGKTDVFWYNDKTGDTSAWLIDGGSVRAYTGYSNVPPSSGWSIKGFGDANGDGKTDVFWYNNKTGDTSAWLINGSSATYPPIYNTVPPSTGWSIQGFGDANGDGKTDIFWYNNKTGDTSAWLINGSSATYPPIYNTVPPSSGWSIQGFGDFDGDGKTDIFWYNYKTGDTSAWLIDGGSVRTYTGYANVPASTRWYIKGFGDFDGDGKTDVFWYNYETGDTSAWLIDGGSVRTYTNYGNVPPSTGWFPLFASQSTGLALHRVIIY